ncbi:MAG: D-tyrosyl-tRNA(Tyr) deacylase [Candidatus Omnitrophica bacterium]|nr:D-tyrosyl-tRNA(Tyr) deacylase [Candidatus Omnitrophota bacterium]MCF7894342.1 D-tyrosyl-tRNA(Tyr) deacylase [Candidatus Omnitrophota bacterium]
MKVLINRINKGKVEVAKEVIASIDKGLAVFVGIEAGNTESNLVTAAKKIVNIRIFEDKTGKMSRSVKQAGLPVLCIPNFTLCASTEKGRRPSFEKAMKPEKAKKLFDKFLNLLHNELDNIQSGIFGAHMDIKLELDGPVNIILEI